MHECVALKCATRVFEFLKKNVTQDVSSDTGSKARLVADKKTEEGGLTQVYEVDAAFASPIQSALMFLSNVTIIGEGAQHLLGEDKTKGVVLENLLGMFNYFKTNPTFDFISNILANVSAVQPGRQHLIETK